MASAFDVDAGVTEGEILAEKYRVEKVLGVGGMGVVVAARHIELDEKVAIKFLLPAMLADGVSIARFQREAKAAVRIKSEHVARVFDVGRLQNGAPYMVMEFLEGSDLAGVLAERGVLPLGQALDFILQTCVAVADAHARGIIHRDLKPANLFCVRRSDGQLSIKVLDFGISKLAETDGSGMSFTQTSAMMGSPLYMSPEQFRSAKNVDGRTDIWAIGAILFELVTGKPPFTAGSVPELAIKVSTEQAPSAAQVNPTVPPGLATVIAACLERDVGRRPRNVAELALALLPFAPPAARALVDRVVAIAGQSVSEQGLRPSQAALQDGLQALGTGDPRSANAVQGGTAPPTQWTAPGGTPRRSMVATLGVIAGVAIVLGGGGAVWWTAQRAVPEVIESASVVDAPPVEKAGPKVSAVAQSAAPPVAVAPVVAPSASADPPRALQPEPSPPTPLRAPKSKRATAAPVAPAPPQPAVTKTPPAPQPAERVNCDPPFFFDAKGNRVFKQECL
jgi:eukaryotic-like serine/threonine-protein kinase